MRAGKSVTYVDKSGRKHNATVTAVTGTGLSGYKVLSLEYVIGKRSVAIEDAPHEGDHSGGGYWYDE